MIRAGAPCRPLVVNTFLPNHAQCTQRNKSFLRKVDKYGEAFYVVAKKMRKMRRLDDSPGATDFFISPPVVLDLIQDGQRGVREHNEELESRLIEKYEVMPQRKALRARLEGFSHQIRTTERKAMKIYGDTTNTWRIVHHDTMSVALRGGVKSSHSAVELGVDDKDEPLGILGQLNPRRAPDIINQVGEGNGIPNNARMNDQVLLQWLLLRSRNLDSLNESTGKAPPTAEQFLTALGKKRSISGIRRLVFQSVDAGLDLNAVTSAGLDKVFNMPQAIYTACAEILDHYSDGDRTPFYEALTFVGNLKVRLGDSGNEVAYYLDQLAIRASEGAEPLE